MPPIPALHPLRSRPCSRAQRGAATLIVVMVLFFIVALVAAYTSRNLIFEQRTSANQYAATQAFEAAEAGLEWALAMLNGGRITDQCVAETATVANPTFRQRYLGVSATDGSITVLSPGGQALTPGCVFDATDEDKGPHWRCECPRNAPPALVAPAGTAVAPAFRVRFVIPDPALRPDLVRIESNGCTRLDNACLNFPSQAVAGSGRASVSVLASLRSALPRPPFATLTAGGDVTGAGLTLVNDNPAGPNITVHAGGHVPDLITGPPGMPMLIGPAGMPSAEKIASAPMPSALADPPLTQGDRLFVSHFGMAPSLYRDQPAAVHLECGDVACTGAALRSVVELNPDRVVWVMGDVDIDSDGDIGAPDAPSVLVLSGNLTFSAAAVNLYGAVLSRSDDWTIAGPGRIHGTTIALGNVVGTGTPAIVYNRAILDRLRLTHGSFMRVPGSWKDFP